MVAILLIGSGLAGLIGAAAAWWLEGGLVAIIISYAVVGNLAFTLLAGLIATRPLERENRDFTSEIEADLLALLEERYERLHYVEDGPMRWCPLLRRAPKRRDNLPAKERRLFRAGQT